MVKENEEKKREEYVIRVGPLLKKILDKQKQKIKQATWDCVDASEYEAGEIIAKKITEGNIL